MSEIEEFGALLGRVRPRVERRLRTVWSAKKRELERHGAAIVAVASAAEDLTLRGGKRFRAGLVVAAYEGVAPRASADVAVRAAAAFELLQSYLLIQDDWMDKDDQRRGGPSVHAALAGRFGDAHLGASLAILASDVTWGLAVAEIAALRADPSRVLAALALVARVHEDVVVGQGLDVLGDAEDVEAMHALKTGSYTTRGPLLLGATLAGADARTLRALGRFAAPLGVAFQLRDDLLGAFAPPEETGKPFGGDLRAGKRTAVVVAAESRLDRAGRAALGRAFGKSTANDAAIQEATAALASCGARAAVAARLEELVEDAETRARDLPLTAKARGWLAGAARALEVAA